MARVDLPLPDGPTNEESLSSYCDNCCGVKAVESQRSEELEQAKCPEVTLQERRLGKKEGAIYAVPCPCPG